VNRLDKTSFLCVSAEMSRCPFPVRVTLRVSHIYVLMLSLLAVSVCGQDAMEAKTEQIGIGEWNLVIKTESASGEGCEELGIDQEIRTGLVISPSKNQVCSRATPECKYIIDWKVYLSIDT
jgi:hypothetical protein